MILKMRFNTDIFANSIIYLYFVMSKWYLRHQEYCDSSIWYNHSIHGYINFGDECWRRNVLVTTLRCWWPFWPFLAPTSFNISVGDQHPKIVKNCHQYQNPATNIQKWTCHHYLFNRYFFLLCVIFTTIHF